MMDHGRRSSTYTISRHRSACDACANLIVNFCRSKLAYSLDLGFLVISSFVFLSR